MNVMKENVIVEKYVEKCNEKSHKVEKFHVTVSFES